MAVYGSDETGLRAIPQPGTVQGVAVSGSIGAPEHSAPVVPIGAVSGISLRLARAALVERLLAGRPQIIAAIIAGIRAERYHPVLDGEAELAAGFKGTVAAVVDFCIRCMAAGHALADALPESALEQARLAASRGVPLRAIVCRYDLGARIMWRLVLEEIERAAFTETVQFELVREAIEMQATLLDRFHDTIGTVHEREQPPGLCAEALKRLTPREREVWALVQRDFSDQEIAAELQISIWTVREHVRNAREKLGVKRRRSVTDVTALARVGEGGVTRLNYVRPRPARAACTRYGSAQAWRVPSRAPTRVPLAIRRAA